MTISRITLQAHIQQSQPLASENQAHGVSGTDDFNDERLTFLDWLTEVNPASSKQAGVSVNPEIELNKDVLAALETSTPTESLYYSSSSKDAEALTASSDDDNDPVDPKQLVHLLHEALTPTDTLYLKQCLIPNLPIVVGHMPIQQLFPTAEEGEISYRGFEISDNLKQLVQKGVKTGAPIRIELDANASVVLKFKNGRVSAEFLSNDKIGAWLMKQQLETLKQQLLSKQLPVDDVTYRQQKKNRQPFLQENAEQQ